MPRSRKIDLEEVQIWLDKTCPKCRFTITPDLVRPVDSKRIEGPMCGERFQTGGILVQIKLTGKEGGNKK
jgi:hypothetical protein